MKNVIVLVLVAFVASSRSFVLKHSDDSDPINTIETTKSNILSETTGLISNLKNSALEKKEAVISGVKDAASAKLGLVTRIKDAKFSFLKGVASAELRKLAAIRDTKEAFITSFIESKKAHLANAVNIISAKTKGLLEYTAPIKAKATAIVAGAVGKVQSKIAQKKELLHSLKKPATTVTNNGAIVPQEPYKVHTYVSNETPVVGKVIVQETPVPVDQTVESPKVTEQASASTRASALSEANALPVKIFGVPAQAYGPPADTYGPPKIL